MVTAGNAPIEKEFYLNKKLQGNHLLISKVGWGCTGLIDMVEKLKDESN